MAPLKGGDANGGLAPFLQFADAAGIILLAISSHHKTWDMLYTEYGTDVAFIDEALAQTFSRIAVDSTRIAVEGFSDGASFTTWATAHFYLTRQNG